MLPSPKKSPASCRPLALDFGRSKVPVVWLVLIWHDSTTHPHLANMFVSFDRTLKFASSIWMRKKNIGKSEPQNQSDYFPRNSFRKHYPSKKKYTTILIHPKKKICCFRLVWSRLVPNRVRWFFPQGAPGQFPSPWANSTKQCLESRGAPGKQFLGHQRNRSGGEKPHSFGGSQKIPKKVKIWTNSQSTSSLWSGRCV